MKQNLDTLKTEILEYAASHGFVLFHGMSRATETSPVVYWDAGRYPDFRDFLVTAQAAGAKLVTFHYREFIAAAVDDALDRLDDCDMAPEDRLPLERRLRDMRIYQGFTCAIELSFDHQGRVYLYDLHTDWYADFLDTVDEIDCYLPGDEGEEDEGPIGGYFSRN